MRRHRSNLFVPAHPVLIAFFLVGIDPALCVAQDDDRLAVTLPTGKVVHFPTAEQKAKYPARLDQIKQASAPPVTTVAANGGETPEQVKEEWEKGQADKKAQEEIDKHSTLLWFKISSVKKDGCVARWAPEGQAWSSTPVFLTCDPPASWTDNMTFKAKVYASAPAKLVDYTRLANYRIDTGSY